MSGLWNSMVNLSPTGKIAASLILKDAVGCYLYVSQARSNKKFTPQQRADVANYDLANGIINIGLQLLAVKPIENLMKKVVESKVVKHYFKDIDNQFKNPDVKSFMKFVKKHDKLTKGTVALMSVLICQYFIKRVVSPFFSVPAGEMTKNLGIVKPKLYAGETYNGKRDLVENRDNKDVKTENKIETPKLDIMSTSFGDTNLINRYKKQNELV